MKFSFKDSFKKVQIHQFWMSHPALLYGLSIFIGTSLALFPINMWFLCSVLISLFIPLIVAKDAIQQAITRILLTLAIGGSAFCFAKGHYLIPSEQERSPAGIAHVKIDDISLSKTSFGKAWIFRGTLKSFMTSGDNNEPNFLLAKNIPIRLQFPLSSHEQLPLGGKNYFFYAQLKSSARGFSLALRKNAPSDSMKDPWNWTEWRFAAKHQIVQIIDQSIEDSRTASFLAGIATGSLDNSLLNYELGRFGLQHLMAVSGFHFAILATMLGLLLRLFLPNTFSLSITIGLLSGYFLFLGNSPSVIRAWVMITISLTGLLLHKRNTPLNALGIALIVVSLWDPFSINSIGFQFSFAITTAILLWFDPFDQLLVALFPIRSLRQIVGMHRIQQYGYALIFFLRKACALTCAINLVALPLTLFYFQKFPLMSLAYNLFFPCMVSISLLLLMGALALFWLPFASHSFFWINEKYTQFLLEFTSNVPKSFDLMLRTNSISTSMLLFYLLFVFCVGIYIQAASKSHLNTL